MKSVSLWSFEEVWLMVLAVDWVAVWEDDILLKSSKMHGWTSVVQEHWGYPYSLAKSLKRDRSLGFLLREGIEEVLPSESG